VAATLVCAVCNRRASTVPDEQVWGGRQRGQEPVIMTRPRPEQGDTAPVLAILERELTVNLARLQSDVVDQPAYFMAYDLVEVEELTIAAHDGALVRNDLHADRTIDIDVRVGSPRLDNSHSQGGDYGPGNGLGSGLPVSMQDEPLSLAQSLWLETEGQYRDAVAALSTIASGEQLRSDSDEPRHPDFSTEEPTHHIEPPRELDLDAVAQAWAPRIRAISAALSDGDHVLENQVTLVAVVRNRYMVTSAGTRVQGGHTRLQILMAAATQAEDGMELQRAQNVEVHHPEQLPSVSNLRATAERLRKELRALRVAPIAEPYTGPAVLGERAAGVFFHEIFGHRLEGHRQKDDLEGQTFAHMLGKRVLPSFLDVVDDPTVAALGGVPLSGHYFVDDEGVPARRAVLVERGRLKGFLLSRSPVLPFRHSNGHGRRDRGYQAVARQANLIVSSRKRLSKRELRAELINEASRQGKPYGLWFSDIEGGFTTTDRAGPQSFKVLPLLVYRVYRDRRPDELVRGADLVGTPLAAFETIIATGDRPGIFNGMCGGESGWLPVAAVSPALLLRGIEIERAIHERDRPPLLPPPSSSRRPNR
jgi:hypothetical protein